VPSGGLTAGRADALYVVNDALGSFLLRANEVIDQVPMSAALSAETYVPDIHRARALDREDRRASGCGCKAQICEH
jgi:hypothetical protein